MLELRNIALYTLRSEYMDELAELVSRLFPHSSVHVVTTITPIRSRALYTKLLSNTLNRIAEEAVRNAEEALKRCGARVARSEVLRGRPVKAITEYVEKFGIGLVATLFSLGLNPEEATREIGSLFAANLRIPVMLYTGLSHIPRRIDTLLMVVKGVEGVRTGLAISDHLSKVGRARVVVQLLGKPRPRELEYIKIQVHTKGMALSIPPPLPRSRERLVKAVLGEAEHSSVALLERSVLRVLRRLSFLPRGRLSREESALLGSMPIPTIVF